MLKMNKFNLAVTLSLLVSSSINADVITLNEEKVVEMALKRNEAIGISSAEIEIAKSKVEASTSSLYPTLSLQAQIQKTRGKGSSAPNAYDWNEKGSVGVTQPVYTFGKLSSAIDIAKSSESLSRVKSLATQADVKNTARKLYYRVLYSNDLLKASKDSFKNANKNKKTLEKRVSYGRISRNDNLKMQADIASRRPFLIDSEKNLDLAKLDLLNFLAIEQGSEVRFEKESLREISLRDDSNASNVENNLDVKILNENLKLRELSIESEKSNRMPTLNAFATFSPSNYKDGFLGDKIKDQEDLTFGLSFTFDWPFGGSKNDAIQVKRTEAKIARLQLTQEKRNQKVQLEKLYKQKESLERKLESELEAIKLALSSYEVSLGAFATGGVSQLQLNDSELLLTNNRISYAGTKFEILNTIIDIERLTTISPERGK